MSEKPKPRKPPPTGFDTGVEVLRLNLDALTEVYKDTIDVVKKMMNSGSANGMLGYFATLIYMDLLHGGAYACSIRERPWYFGGDSGGSWSGTTSRYDPGPIKLPSQGLLPWLTGLFAGQAASPIDLFDEVIINSNCPHIFPKLLSDEAYAVGKLGLAFSSGTDIFKQGATGLQTLVNAETDFVKGNVIEPLKAVGETIPKLAALIPGLLAKGA